MNSNHLNFIVEYNNYWYYIAIDTENSLGTLKHLIFTETNVPIFRQIFPNSDFQAKMKSDKCKLKELALKPMCILKLKDVMWEPLPVPVDSLSKNFSVPFANQKRLCREINIKIVGMPREGKKLVVLGLDHVLFDCNSPCHNFSGRPFLQEFLTSLYINYDIAIWSDKQMEVLKQQINILGLNKHPNYKILFYLDKQATVSMPAPHNMCMVKPLEVIWKKFPVFNRKNTIICDNKREIFCLNPENGILISHFSFEDYAKDEELLKLSSYLEHITQFNDLSAVNHITWNL